LGGLEILVNANALGVPKKASGDLVFKLTGKLKDGNEVTGTSTFQDLQQRQEAVNVLMI
jgi:hypothetical protein